MKKNKANTRKSVDNVNTTKTVEQHKRRKLLDMRGKVIWEGNLDEMRGIKTLL